jgi:hypothetical protein
MGDSMQLHSQRNLQRASVCGLLEEDRDTQLQHVRRILQDSWVQFASDLETLEAAVNGTE